MSADRLAAPFRAIRVVELVDFSHETFLFPAELRPGQQLGEEVCAVLCPQYLDNVHDFLIPEPLYPCVSQVQVLHLSAAARSLDLPYSSR